MSEKPIIFSLRVGTVILSHTVKVDRSSDYGNPFVMNGATDAERDRVCDLFEQYAAWRLSVEPEWLKPLRGKNLACWCAPKRCHGETLLRLANEVQQ